MIRPLTAHRSSALARRSWQRACCGLAVAVAVLLGGVFGSRARAQTPPPTPGEVRDLIAAGRADDAIAGARAILQENPKDEEGHVLMANALLRKAVDKAGGATGAVGASSSGSAAPRIAPEDAQAVSAELEAAIALAPLRKDLYLGLVDVQAAAGLNDGMIEQIARAGRRFPADENVMSSLLEIGFERETRDDPFAGRILEAVHSVYPRRPRAALGYASWLVTAGGLDRSIGVLEKGLSDGGDDAALLEALGDGQCFRLDFEAAAGAYARASSIDPKARGLRLRWAAALHVVDPRSAKVVLEPLLGPASASTGKPTVTLTPGAAAVGEGRVDRGASALSRALVDTSPTGLEAQALAKAFFQSGQSPAAMAETQVALLRDPLVVESLVLRAQIYTKIGLHKEAAASLDRALKIFETAQGRTFAYSSEEVRAEAEAARQRAARAPARTTP